LHLSFALRRLQIYSKPALALKFGLSKNTEPLSSQYEMNYELDKEELQDSADDEKFLILFPTLNLTEMILSDEGLIFKSVLTLPC
jgi:hypothetical protein